MGIQLIDYQPIYSEKQGVQFTGLLAGSAADCHLWADILAPQSAEVLAAYTTGAYAGKAAITSHNFGKGKAIYIGCHLEPADLARVLLTLIASAGVSSPIQPPPGVEITTRRTAKQAWTYLLNHTANPQSVDLAAAYVDARDRSPVSGTIHLDPYGVRVLMKT